MASCRGARTRVDPARSRPRSKVPVIGTYDDHDFGINNGGSDYADKEGSQALLLDFLGEPADSARRQRSGVYTSYTFGTSYPVVQIILLVGALALVSRTRAVEGRGTPGGCCSQ